MKNRDLLNMIYQLTALGAAITDSAERCTIDSDDRDGASNLMSLIYLFDDLAREVKEEAEATLDCPDSNLDKVRAENEQLRRLVVDLRLQIAG